MRCFRISFLLALLLLSLFVVTVGAEGEPILTVPEGERGQYCIGYAAEQDGEVVFLPLGATYDESLSFTPVYLEMTTAGGSIRLSDEGNGMRFVTTVSRADFAALWALDENVSWGTLIVPQGYVGNIGGRLTHSALDSAGLKRLDVASVGWYGENEENYFFAGSVVEILTANYTLKYTAIGYMKVNYTNGTSAYIYATPEGGKQVSRSVFQLADVALSDIVSTESAAYPHAVSGGYSRYTEDERAEMGVFTASVIRLKIDPSMTGNKSLDASMLGRFKQVFVKDTDSAYADIRGGLDIKHTGALVITAKNGAYLTSASVAGVVVMIEGDTHSVAATYVLWRGKILIPHSDFTDNH